MILLSLRQPTHQWCHASCQGLLALELSRGDKKLLQVPLSQTEPQLVIQFERLHCQLQRW